MIRLLLLIPFGAFSCFLFFPACRNNSVTPATMGQPQLLPDSIQVTEVSPTGAATFKVVEGMILWSGQPAFGTPHTGTIRISDGKLVVSYNRLLSGTVMIDM